MLIRHSLIIQVYNHENYLTQCLNSVLNQSVIPYEIIVGDDCSEDRSVAIISSFVEKYPELLKFYPQPINLGTYEHLNFLCSKVCGDVISIMSGDDFLMGDMFEEFNKVILQEKLKPCEERFILAANHWILEANDQLFIFENSHVRFKNLFSERLRYGISYRDCGLSKKLFDSLDTINPKPGILADWLWGFDQVMKCDKLVLVPEAFYVYRTGIGVVSRTTRREFSKSSLEVLKILKKKYAKHFKLRDSLYLKYLKYKFTFEIHVDLITYLLFLFYTILNFWNFSKGNPLSDNLRAFSVVYQKLKSFILKTHRYLSNWIKRIPFPKSINIK